MAQESAAFKKLLAAHEEVMETLNVVSRQAPWEDREFYANWVGQFYYFVAHATRLLAASAARLTMDRDALHIRFLDHCQEEKHHEKLLLKDLEEMGRSIDEFPESPTVAHLYQSQYYLIDYRDPIALFGSVFYLEGLSLHSGLEIYGRLKKVHGDDACNFIRVHVTEDQDHMEKAHAALRTLPPDQLQLIDWSMRQTAGIYISLIQELQAKCGQKKKSRVA